jgi:hypothetical protein
MNEIYFLMDLPDDLLMLIIDNFFKDIQMVKRNLNFFSNILNVRTTCKNLRNIIKLFKLKQLKLQYALNNYNKIQYCVNVNCYFDTDFVEYNRYRHYVHSHQEALNNIQIYTSSKKYIKTNMPYCFECMKLYSNIIYSNNKNRLIQIADQGLSLTLNGWEILPANRSLYI